MDTIGGFLNGFFSLYASLQLYHPAIYLVVVYLLFLLLVRLVMPSLVKWFPKIAVEKVVYGSWILLVFAHLGSFVRWGLDSMVDVYNGECRAGESAAMASDNIFRCSTSGGDPTGSNMFIAIMATIPYMVILVLNLFLLTLLLKGFSDYQKSV